MAEKGLKDLIDYKYFDDFWDLKWQQFWDIKDLINNIMAI